MSSEHTSAAATEAKFYVYVHVKADDGEPFYVGKGSGKRAWSNRGRNAWWRRVVAKHGLVVRIQKHFQDEGEAFASEIETIAILRDLGYELCNLTDGGEGPSGWVPSAETKAKIAEHTRQRMAHPESRAALAERNRQREWSHEARQAQAERAKQCVGESALNAKISDEVCRLIFRLQSQGLTQTEIACQVEISRAQVCRILSGKNRRNIYLEFHPDESRN